MRNLGVLYNREGRLGEAERLLNDTFQLARDVHGPKDRRTLTVMYDLGTVLANEGRYGEAEQIYRDVVKLNLEVRGSLDMKTLQSMVTLADMFVRQKRYYEAEDIYLDAFPLYRSVVGLDNRDTLYCINGLAAVYAFQGDYRGAAVLYLQALEHERKVLGPSDPETLRSMGGLAATYDDLHRDSEAERLYLDTVKLMRKVHGPEHRSTLASLNNLAVFYLERGRYSEAGPLLRELVSISPKVFGRAHPNTLTAQLSLVRLLAGEGNIAEAVAFHAQMMPEILNRLGVELYSTEAIAARRRLVISQTAYQDIALTLALAPEADSTAAELAALALLRFKGLAVEEEGYLARLVHRTQDPAIRDIASQIGRLHAQLAQLQNQGRPTFELGEQLNAKELELGRLSRAYGSQLQVRNANVQEIRSRLKDLPSRSALLELRQFSPLDLRTQERAPPHWAGVLIGAEGDIKVRDLGATTSTAGQVESLLQGSVSVAGSSSRALYEQLVAPFAPELARVDRIYIAPDGMLYLVPFGLLVGSDQRALLETKDVRLLQTGRDLLRSTPEEVRRGLVAMGGIDFDHAPTEGISTKVQIDCPSFAGRRVTQLTDFVAENAGDASRIAYARDRAAESLHFGPLPNSADEVKAIAGQYCAAHPDEGIEVDIGTAASKARLMGLDHPPRVLHLATHGFYRVPKEPADRPLLLSGVALAGANVSLREGGGIDGILSALETVDLNLDGTELVVLSACETAQGKIDYGEGVSGLLRALRTAGARNVLVTLRPISDPDAQRFMERFYGHWLGEARGDLATALRQTQYEYLRQSQVPAGLTTPQVSAPVAGTVRSDGASRDARGAAPIVASPSVKPDTTWSSFILIGE